MQFYSEVLAFAFFTTQPGNPMLPVPFTLLGARRIVNNITGETSNTQADCGSISPTNWLNSATAQGEQLRLETIDTMTFVVRW